MIRARRAFVIVWLVLGLAGAINHTIAERWFGGTINLVLPHLAYGHVMFNHNPRRVPVFTYARADGERRPLADLEPRPAPGYKRARVAIDAMITPIYMRDLCNRALRRLGDEITIFIDGYDVDVGRERPVVSSTVKCDAKPR